MVVDQAGEAGRVLGVPRRRRPPPAVDLGAALDLPGDRALAELRDVPREERAGEPVVEGLADGLGELPLDGGRGRAGKLGRESLLDPVGQGRLAAAGGKGDDAVAVGPVGTGSPASTCRGQRWPSMRRTSTVSRSSISRFSSGGQRQPSFSRPSFRSQ